MRDDEITQLKSRLEATLAELLESQTNYQSVLPSFFSFHFFISLLSYLLWLTCFSFRFLLFTRPFFKLFVQTSKKLEDTTHELNTMTQAHDTVSTELEQTKFEFEESVRQRKDLSTELAQMREVGFFIFYIIQKFSISFSPLLLGHDWEINCRGGENTGNGISSMS